MQYDTGPEFNVLGPDIGTVQDLSGDEANWLLGRQSAVIVSAAGAELCYLRNVTAIGGGVWTADGLIRGRFDSVPVSHPAGAEIYIFEQADVMLQRDVLIVVGNDLYAKTQPKAAGILPLDADPAVAVTIQGKGRTAPPVPAGGLAITAPTLINVYQTGDDASFRWDYSVPQLQGVGAGHSPAGNAIPTAPSPDQDFILEIRDVTGVTVERTETLTSASYTYTNATLIADLGSELDYQVWVFQRRNGLLSTPVKLLVEKI